MKIIFDVFGVFVGEYDYDENGNFVVIGLMIVYCGLFFIDKNGVVMYQLVNNFLLGRNVDEVFCMVDVFQFFEENGEVCLVNWSKGEVGMKVIFEGVVEYLFNN